MRKSARSLLIGDPADPHVVEVVGRLPSAGTVVIDAASVPSILRRLDLGGAEFVDRAGHVVSLDGTTCVRGWIRRLAPAGWDDEVVLGSHGAAQLASRIALLAALLRDSGITWLCGVDALFAAENKIVQYRAARAAGLRVPRTLICPDPAGLAAALGEPFVIKPLGPGNFTDAEGRDRVVHARAVTASDLATADLLDAPFLAQELLHAHTHLRVVTVDQRAWTAELDADGLPLDWRSAEQAHYSFQTATGWDDVERDAVRLAQSLNAGFTCQDWIIDDTGPAFVDVNPGGQWLFLPQAITTQVADHLADWLRRT